MTSWVWLWCKHVCNCFIPDAHSCMWLHDWKRMELSACIFSISATQTQRQTKALVVRKLPGGEESKGRWGTEVERQKELVLSGRTCWLQMLVWSMVAEQAYRPGAAPGLCRCWWGNHSQSRWQIWMGHWLVLVHGGTEIPLHPLDVHRGAVSLFNPSWQLCPTQPLTHFPSSGIEERIIRVKVRKLVGWDKDSLIGKYKIIKKSIWNTDSHPLSQMMNLTQAHIVPWDRN